MFRFTLDPSSGVCSQTWSINKNDWIPGKIENPFTFTTERMILIYLFSQTFYKNLPCIFRDFNNNERVLIVIKLSNGAKKKSVWNVGLNIFRYNGPTKSFGKLDMA